VTRSHKRLLAAVARLRKREKADSHRAIRTRKQVSAARARRRLATGDEDYS
jgi:hypothetical protein